MAAGHMGLVLLYSAQLQRGMMDYMRPATQEILRALIGSDWQTCIGFRSLR